MALFADKTSHPKLEFLNRGSTLPISTPSDFWANGKFQIDIHHTQDLDTFADTKKRGIVRQHATNQNSNANRKQKHPRRRHKQAEPLIG
jgi:hypothetical protein